MSNNKLLNIPLTSIARTTFLQISYNDHRQVKQILSPIEGVNNQNTAYNPKRNDIERRYSIKIISE
jgi:hypothetical protein